jgi:threonine synthase
MSGHPFDSQEDEEDLYGFPPASTFSQSSNAADSIAPSSSISNALSSSTVLTSLRASISAGRAIRVSDEEGLEALKEYKVPLS